MYIKNSNEQQRAPQSQAKQRKPWHQTREVPWSASEKMSLGQVETTHLQNPFGKLPVASEIGLHFISIHSQMKD